jgi:hypothetical protein
MKKSLAIAAIAAVSLVGANADAALLLSQTDAATPVSYANGGGGGFGGTLGSGSISFDAVGPNLTISLTPGAALNDIVVIHLDTKPGGFTDAGMSDTADGGRRAVTNPSGLSGDITYPLRPDYALAIGGFGSVLFELTGGSLNFLSFNAGTTITFPLASIGITSIPSVIDWFAYYTSESGFMSNETLPLTSYNSGGNLGFNATAEIENYNQFRIPEPATLGVLAGAGLIALRRRK